MTPIDLKQKQEIFLNLLPVLSVAAKRWRNLSLPLYLLHTEARASARTCYGREEQCKKPSCSIGDIWPRKQRNNRVGL